MKKRIASLLMALMLCLTLLPTTALADGGHSHPICGASCSDGKHIDTTFDAPLSDWYGTLQIGDESQMGEGAYYVLPAGNYYLPDSATINKPILIKGGEVNLCLNGNMIQLNGSALIQEVFKVEGGTLNLTDCKGGGKVCHLQETCSGRGVTLDNDTAASVTFNMYGGTICENTHQLSGENAVYGGGVYVFSNGTFNMYGGKIYNNKAKTVGTGNVYGGGVYNSGTFNLLGGEISSNETVMGQNGSEAKGSGVYNCGTFNMKTGSVIKKNSVLGQSDSSVYGGGVYNSGSFTMNGGEISENESGAYIGSAYGGGVYNAGTFELENGKITGNIVRTWGSMPIYGAGVCNYKKFVMSDGEITNNKAETTQDKAYGGGIYYYYSGNTSDTTEINGGKITGNTAKTAGGGISMENSRYFKLGGNPVIWDNKVNNKQNNVVTNIYQKLTRPLTDGAKVGITVKNFEEKDRMVEVDSTISGDMSKYFVSDDSGYSLYQKGTGIYRKVAHNHTWTYELVSGTTDTVKATCIADVGKCEYDGDGGTLKIKMKYSGYEYDGTKPKAELEANNWHGEAVADITIE